MFAPPSNRPSLTPIPDLLTAALTTCFRSALPLVGTAYCGALAANAVAAFVSPNSLALQLAWGLVIAALTLAFLSPTVFLTSRALRRESLSVTAAMVGLEEFGPRYFAMGLLLGVATAPLLVAPYLAPIAVYPLIRFSLAGPSIVLEQKGVFAALVSSWRLLKGRWWRTFALQMIVGVFAFILTAAAASAATTADNPLFTIVSLSIAQGIAAPLLAAVELLMFYDYRFADTQADQEDQGSARFGPPAERLGDAEESASAPLEREQPPEQ